MRPEEIAHDLLRRIDSGELGCGERLPTIPQLRDHYGASGASVAAARQTLIEDGVLVNRPGVGTVVVAVDGENRRLLEARDRLDQQLRDLRRYVDDPNVRWG
ncbi:GntR family transcriptional regulator [Nocardioides sp. Root190]|uniref:GntR family transcriptional regulator n=1 Tax=Nocardioides sp. Root190 TaxID=1736488 RepID=UPI000AE4CD51|nr:GntR family transcriptional regulator [Nocardioides sp. Root190]